MKIVYRFSLLVIASCVGAGGFSIPSGAQASDNSLPDSPSALIASVVPDKPAALSEDASEVANDPVTGSDDSGVPESPNEREAGWKTLPGNFLHDQKRIWMFPVQLAHGRHWVPTLAVAGITTGLIYADPHAMPYFAHHQKNLDKFNDVFDAYISTGEVISIPALLMASGYIRHDHRTVSSALLCAEAYGDSAVVNLVMKAITRRQRPVDVPLNGTYRDTFFNGGKSPFHGSSFPSGHTTGVFSVATVVANRYERHKWVPYLAYGFATVISLSRITTAAHWPSDVFLGAAIGYSTAKYVVLRPD
jgi:membrane-associated phospholipid phosphatase